jgi:WD40 repeat protein
LIDLWNIETKTLEKQFKKQGKSTSSRCVVTADFVIGGDRHTNSAQKLIDDVVFWDKQSGKEVKRLAGHTKDILGFTLNSENPLEFVSFSKDGSFIVQVDRWYLTF